MEAENKKLLLAFAKKEKSSSKPEPLIFQWFL